MTRSLTNALNLVPWFWGRGELVFRGLGGRDGGMLVTEQDGQFKS